MEIFNYAEKDNKGQKVRMSNIISELEEKGRLRKRKKERERGKKNE